MTRNDWLFDSLRRYLDRRSMPQGLKDKPQAQTDEIQALATTLYRLAPVKGYGDWWDEFSERLAEDAQTRAWPTQGEMKKAAQATKGPRFEGSADYPEVGSDAWSLMVMAKRIRAGEPIGEGWIYGMLAAELLRFTDITIFDLEPYRKGAFFNRKSVYGKEAALEWEREAKERHASAEIRLSEKQPEAAE